MIRQYSLAKDGNRKLAPSFNTREFRCRDGSDTVMVDETLTVVLQCIREHFGKPTTRLADWYSDGRAMTCTSTLWATSA